MSFKTNSIFSSFPADLSQTLTETTTKIDVTYNTHRATSAWKRFSFLQTTCVWSSYLCGCPCMRWETSLISGGMTCKGSRFTVLMITFSFRSWNAFCTHTHHKQISLCPNSAFPAQPLIIGCLASSTGFLCVQAFLYWWPHSYFAPEMHSAHTHTHTHTHTHSINRSAFVQTVLSQPTLLS